MLSRSTFLALSAALPLAACASASTNYPSLAIRDAERATGIFTPDGSERPEPAPPAPPAPELLDRLAQLQAEAQSAHRAFVALSPQVQRQVTSARGAGRGSDRWSAAQIAISELDIQRSLTAIAMADLDEIYVGQAVALETRAVAEQARSDVAALLQEEDRVLQRLKSTLAQ